ncbi:MAG: lysophospholipid acyltransferase family protein [Anaerolineae bacterium]
MWYRFVYLFAKILLKLVMHLEVAGRENVPERGPFILATNHLHFLDPPIIFVALPFRRITVLAAEKWENVFPVGPLLKSMGAIFVQRGEVDRRALAALLQCLEGGGIVGLAPEGTRSPVGALQRGKMGIAYLATKADVPVLPVGISGQQHIYRDWKRFRRPRVRVRIGALITLPPVDGYNKGKQLQALTDQVMVELARLIDPDLRGVYAEAVGRTKHLPEV